MTTKVHAVADGLGNPLHFILSSGSRNDICLAKELLEGFDLTNKLILADKGYDSKKFTDWIESRGGTVVIPSHKTNKIQRDIDLYTYNERHLVENLFLKLKNNQRFATRYEKSSVIFQGVTLFLLCISHKMLDKYNANSTKSIELALYLSSALCNIHKRNKRFVFST